MKDNFGLAVKLAQLSNDDCHKWMTRFEMLQKQLATERRQWADKEQKYIHALGVFHAEL